MTPIGNHILVKPCQSENRTEGGLFIPESVQERSCKVEILKVGKGVKGDPMKIPSGVVGFHIKGAGMEVIVGGISYWLMSQKDILAYSEKE